MTPNRQILVQSEKKVNTREPDAYSGLTQALDMETCALIVAKQSILGVCENSGYAF